MRAVSALIRYAAALALLAPSAYAQDWPTRPVRIIVPNAAGGTSDIAARMAAEHFSNVFKQPFVVENRPGAGGIIGMQGIIGAAPDGYTIGVTTVSTLALVPIINPKATYKPLTDFTHIGYMVGSPVVLAMAPAKGVSTLSEFIALGASTGNALSFASSGVGSDGHLIGEAIGARTNVKVEHVPYRVTTQALQDVVGAHVVFSTFTLSSSSSFIRAGTLKGIAITAAERLPDFPNVPTFKELGYPGLVSSTWFAMSGPPNLPADVVEKLNRELRVAMAKPEVEKIFRQSGMQTEPFTAPQFAKFVEDEIGRWKPLIEANKLVGAGGE